MAPYITDTLHLASDFHGCTKPNYVGQSQHTLSCFSSQRILISLNVLMQERSDWNTLGIFFSAARVPVRGFTTDLHNNNIQETQLNYIYLREKRVTLLINV